MIQRWVVIGVVQPQHTAPPLYYTHSSNNNAVDTPGCFCCPGCYLGTGVTTFELEYVLSSLPQWRWNALAIHLCYPRDTSNTTALSSLVPRYNNGHCMTDGGAPTTKLYTPITHSTAMPTVSGDIGPVTWCSVYNEALGSRRIGLPVTWVL